MMTIFTIIIIVIVFNAMIIIEYYLKNECQPRSSGQCTQILAPTIIVMITRVLITIIDVIMITAK